ncbi:metallophosphoesterase family protein [Paenibacillus sp. MMS20-IR301]|uniref:metallophosphoesterase family protein n=1 Tax=Paenibacillus sp. MMS20-IR301 TaxID=2895946 RepID=UPI0028E43D6F|nr:metallophosphoesterase family protein [Paenibacillus sp. MMS20-IR301]WNS43149.1 metallophosphoesterase family protein [Paenibacillus sp. MMS20-IR301]
MSKFFITDIHGDKKGLELLLRQADVNLSRDQLVVGGDMINRGKDSAGVVRFIKDLMERYPGRVHALIGNHEEMMGDYIRNGDKLWLSHGGQETLAGFARVFPGQAERQAHMEWAYSLPLYFADEEYVYTHAGLDPEMPLEQQSRDILWMTEYEFYRQPREALLTLTNGRPVIHGHTPVERIYYDGVRMNCDMGSNTYSVLEERSLGIVNLTEMTYHVYRQADHRLETRRIGMI